MLQSAQDVLDSGHFVFTRKTYVVSQDQSAVVAHRLKNLLDLDDET
jgi:hypothetical protein